MAAAEWKENIPWKDLFFGAYMCIYGLVENLPKVLYSLYDLSMQRQILNRNKHRFFKNIPSEKCDDESCFFFC